MKPITGKASFSVLLGAAFLMATSSIGPGFMLFSLLLHSLMCGQLLVYPKCAVKILRIRYYQALGI